MFKGLSISYRSKAWRVLTKLETKVIMSDLMTYKQANATFEVTTSEYPDGGKLLGCWIIAQANGIERILC